jgi:HprK-related kinase A
VSLPYATGVVRGARATQTVGEIGVDRFQQALIDCGVGVRLGCFNAKLRTDLRWLAEPLFALYRDYELTLEPAVYSIHQRLISPFRPFGRRRVRLVVDGRVPHEDLPLGQALAVLEWGLNLVIALRMQTFLMLHSAALERNGGLILLPAAPGSGKTTLCVGLAHRGWRLFSDEFGLVRPGTTDFLPLPRPMPLKNESINVIRTFAPEAELGPTIYNTRKGTIAHVKAPTESVARSRETAQPRWIVFPRWQAGHPLSLEPVVKSQAFTQLAVNAFNYETVGERAFDTLKSTIDGVQCFRLTYSNLDDAVSTLTALADGHADGG